MKIFDLQRGYDDRETIKVMEVANHIGWDFRSVLEPKDGVPVGSVEFCEKALEQRPVPDFYPQWLIEHRHRRIDLVREPLIRSEVKKVFAKPAWAYKAEDSRILVSGDAIDYGMWLISDVVEFTDEWRYYISDGKVVASGWYDGKSADPDAPEFPLEIPPWFCGAVDMGYLSTGEFALVESHHPYACGHYSDDHEAFAKWLIRGWEYMVNSHGRKQ